MRNLTATICLTVAVLLGSAGMSWSADFKKGLTAYKSGDYATALREWKSLADRGNPRAQTAMGTLYRIGKGVPKNYKTAVKWYRLAAEPLLDQGYANAQFNLGVMYGSGEGVSQNHKTAVKWYRLAAKQGYAFAQVSLGTGYYMGRGVPQNYKTAVKWYRLAAKQGYANAQFNLGVMYERGQGVPKNYKTTVKWYTLAAEQGYANAQFNLGVMYEKGQGAPKDDRTAVKWYRLAAKQGYPTAQKQVKKLKKKIAEAAKKAAKKAAIKAAAAKKAAADPWSKAFRDKAAAESKKPKNKLSARYLDYMFVKECHKTNRLYIDAPKFKSVKSAIRRIDTYYKSVDKKMDTDAIWKNASNNFEKKFGVSFKNMQAMGNYNDQWKAWCVQAYLSITSFRIPGQKKKGRKKDF